MMKNRHVFLAALLVSSTMFLSCSCSGGEPDSGPVIGGETGGGVNTGIMSEILAWLAPGASVLGWESASGEDVFVSPVSAHGRLMLAADWSSNHGMTSAGAVSHAPALAKVINPRKINYSASAHYVSFFLSDGDNYQWIMNGFDKDFYSVSSVIPARMSFGICSQALERLI